MVRIFERRGMAVVQAINVSLRPPPGTGRRHQSTSPNKDGHTARDPLGRQPISAVAAAGGETDPRAEICCAAQPLPSRSRKNTNPTLSSAVPP